MAIIAGIFALACADANHVAADSAAGSVDRDPSGAPQDTGRPIFIPMPRPDTLRALYVNRWATLGKKVWELVAVANRTEVNALVIDVKDDRGLLLYRSSVPMARQIRADTTQPLATKRLRTLLDSMRAAGIYPIARIVVAKDPLLASARPALSIKRKKAPKESWLDRNRQPWLDPTHREVWKYAADIAAEAVALGFSAVQYDYVRFPDEPRVIREGAYASMEQRSRFQVIHDQLAYLRELTKPLGVPMTIDVFGLTASDTTDMGIGQRWESVIDQADEIAPMVYPSHFGPGTYGIPRPNAEPYRVIDRALKHAIARSEHLSGAARLIPWYQDFTLGSPRYNAAHVRAQIQAGLDNGVPDWMLWNPRSAYTYSALRSDSLPR